MNTHDLASFVPKCRKTGTAECFDKKYPLPSPLSTETDALEKVAGSGKRGTGKPPQAASSRKRRSRLAAACFAGRFADGLNGFLRNEECSVLHHRTLRVRFFSACTRMFFLTTEQKDRFFWKNGKKTLASANNFL
ncbi:hypothetical protein [uncultured Mailhella sp.]|uniref:hypothetical protein n=1 Tax=uncultured Mailhella sp. TaxID=1981031 RepID=UPI0025D7335E|nr:hypothetical protein [uncultured Mailhella sp.]